ncbi:MAG: EamA family transporter [Candidatus Krumholzibacteriota bacterium]|nr:EamA family transporter [Candidatus Krumholzibacteriota bacterium]
MFKNLLLIVLTVCLNTTGQFLMKAGINRIGKIDLHNLVDSFGRVVVSPFVLGGFGTYAISAVLWIIILSRTELGWAFPMVSLSYVITVLVGPVLLNETFSYQRFIGVLVICVGVYLVSRT